ncbi:transcription initiation factor TFIID subunit 3 isoform X1 [Drosophila guanche]|uniref:Blast:Transcription initiation factor TFIID subunit 3 n=2 Tax=Drosophila guanche TaxID=7266 RepID=A0A3B0K458_DROGU|nr:transcription initiation factor TFIID subunit 3 isoform X1 [Drosophila guanche]SPP89007.1 blast:Transcription initiation factor TFIID subunit 3 [Drosophila guanche]
MADKYSSDLMRMVIAQVTQTIGYSSTLSAPLELLQDILIKFMQEFGRDLHGQMEHANRLEPNLQDARLTLKSLSINVLELLDYIENVEPVQFNRDVAVFPIKRASNMNFLKPGSAETLTRPIYIFEYLPPMQPNAEPSEPTSTAMNTIQDSESEKTLTPQQGSVSKVDLESLSMVDNRTQIPIDTQSQSTPLNFPSSKNCDPDNGRTVREMSSVVMTTGGFISPSIEGKLPDAFVPDIIEKYKGLHAPPIPSPVIAPLETAATKPDTSVIEEIRYLNSTASKLNERDHQHIENRNPPTAKNSKKEGKIVTPQENANPSVAVMLNAKAFKKIKKQKYFLSNLSGMERSKAEMNFHGGKAQDKAQRKAMKMFQKLARSQNEAGSSQVLHLKKSKKRVNRGTFPDGSSERIQMEKILKKQAKHKQKRVQGHGLQSAVERKPLDIALPTSDPAHVGVASKSVAKSHEETDLKSNADRRTTVVVAAHMQNQAKFPLVSTASEPTGPQGPQTGVSATKKHIIEPERNKLDIFKKISKPKTSRLEVSALSGTLAVAGSPFESTAGNPPLINLPSGTTITPAPSLGLSMEHINVTSSISSVCHQTLPSYGVMPTPEAPSPQADVDLMIIDSSKPKKRGRKPGGKNQTKLIDTVALLESQTQPQPLPPIQSTKKGKQTHLNALSVLPSSALLMNSSLIPEPPIPTEPLNLSSVPHCKGKEKKERKKYKSRHDAFLPENEKEREIGYSGNSIENTSPTKPILHVTKTSSIVASASQYMAVGGGMPHSSLYPSNQTGIVPLLPLLHFPPRPGLIPSGPGLIPCGTGLFPAAAGLVGFGSSGSFMSFPGTSGSASDSVCRLGAVDTSETDTIGQFLRGPSAQTDAMTERTYCNVAPLVPESMKFSVAGGGGAVAGATTGPTGTEAVSKPKAKSSAQATGNLGDPIEVSDDSDESTQNRKQIIPTNLGRTSTLQSQLLPHATTPATSIDDSQHHSKDILHPSISPNSCESIKKFKKQSKLGHQDVKMLSSTDTPSCNTPCFPEFNMPSFKGGDKFSLAGGADLIPLSRLECGLAYSSQTVPVTSLSAGATSASGLVSAHMNVSEDQQFMPSFSSYEDITITPTSRLSKGQLTDEQKMRKLHKKLKKPKEGKVKKKKEKKDKVKEKERNGSSIHKSEKKIKGPDKKQKKEKKKDKQIIALVPADAEDFQNIHHLPKSNELSSSCEVFSGPSLMPSIPIQPSPKQSPKAPNDTSPILEFSTNPVPKLTLKLGGRSTPIPCADNYIDAQDAGIVQLLTMGGYPKKREHEREDSPELARFSPLVTGPPKAKPCETSFSIISSNTVGPLSNSNTTSSPVKPLTLSMAPMPAQMLPRHPAAANSGGWISNTSNSAVASSTLSASSVLLPQQLMLASKPLMNNLTSVMGISAETPLGTGLLPVSPNNFSDCPPKILELNRPSSYVDAEGNRIWICPACGKVDDGSAMIGCDGCDAWYHWTCVGITVAPKDNDDWFCRVCITKKKVHGSEKKKKRNKKK